VLEFLGRSGWTGSHPVVKRALDFLDRDQTPEGAWYGRWGVNYIYGTSGVLRAMATLGLGREQRCRRAASWLRAVQNADGGWGESCASYDDPSLKGKGESTPSQTAWGLLGLVRSSICSSAKGLTAPGTRSILQGRAFHASSTSNITCTGIVFRSMHW